MKRSIAFLALSVALLLATTASAGVVIYKNNFAKKSDVAAVKKLSGGKKCGKSWKGKKALGVSVAGGRHHCLLRTPVQGDRKLPNHTVQALGKVLKKSHKKARDGLYVGVAVRADKKLGYELRVFPKGRRWQLLRNGSVERKGRSKAINALGKANQVRVGVKGANVTSRVNGSKLGGFRDANPDPVRGRYTAVGFGNTTRTKKDGFGLFDKVRVVLPNP
jgi:hypothetical protein